MRRFQSTIRGSLEQPIVADMRLWIDFSNPNSYTLSGSNVVSFKNLLAPFETAIYLYGTDYGQIVTGAGGKDALQYVGGGTNALGFRMTFDASRPQLTFSSGVTFVFLFRVQRVTGANVFGMQLEDTNNDAFNTYLNTANSTSPTQYAQIVEGGAVKSQSFANVSPYGAYGIMVGQLNRAFLHRSSHAGNNLVYNHGATTTLVNPNKVLDKVRMPAMVSENIIVHEYHMYAEILSNTKLNELKSYFNTKYSLSI